MSVLKSLASVTLLAIFTLGGGLTPDLYAESSTPTTFSAKANPGTKQKTPPPRGTPGGAYRPPARANPPVPVRGRWANPVTVQPPASSVETKHQAGLALVVNYFGSGFGLEYLYALYPFLNVGGSALVTSADLTDDGEGASEFINAQTTAIKLFATVPLFTYFYAGGGLDFNQVSGDYGFEGPAVTGQQIKTPFSGTLVALDAKIGSEWRGPWSTYIGVDWIGSSFPLTGKLSYETNADVEITSQALKSKSPSQRLDEEISAQFRFYYLNIRAGMVF